MDAEPARFNERKMFRFFPISMIFFLYIYRYIFPFSTIRYFIFVHFSVLWNYKIRRNTKDFTSFSALIMIKGYYSVKVKKKIRSYFSYNELLINVTYVCY